MGGEGRKLPAGQPRHLSTASKQISLSSHNIKGMQSKPTCWGQRQYGHLAEPECLHGLLMSSLDRSPTSPRVGRL